MSFDDIPESEKESYPCPECRRGSVYEFRGDWSCDRCEFYAESTSKFSVARASNESDESELKQALQLVAKLQGELSELKEAQRWIPVSEGLPTKPGDYLVCRMYPDYMDSWSLYMDGFEVSYLEAFEGGYIPDEFTHWKKPPAPPQVEPEA